MKRLKLISVAACVGACSNAPSTPTDFCNQFASATCSRLYACATGSALDLIKAKYGDTVDQCAAFEQGELECANVSCVNFASASAGSCINALNAETCDSVSGGDVPTICNDVCGSLGGDAGNDGDTTVNCVSGYVNCGAVCADLNSDPHNCGACGTGCGENTCVGGQCTTTACTQDNDACTADDECCSLFCASDGNCGCIESNDDSVFCSDDSDCCSDDCDEQTGICN